MYTMTVMKMTPYKDIHEDIIQEMEVGPLRYGAVQDGILGPVNPITMTHSI